MLKVGIIADTHGYLNPGMLTFIETCDEVWHAGDWGVPDGIEQLEKKAVLRGVYGNIDGQNIRSRFGEFTFFTTESLNVLMLHIGGYPGKYSQRAKELIATYRPDIFVTGHSHILRVMRDKENQLLYLNPGAAGRSGFHKFSTAIRMTIDKGKPANLEVWETHRATP